MEIRSKEDSGEERAKGLGKWGVGGGEAEMHVTSAGMQQRTWWIPIKSQEVQEWGGPVGSKHKSETWDR